MRRWRDIVQRGEKLAAAGVEIVPIDVPALERLCDVFAALYGGCLYQLARLVKRNQVKCITRFCSVRGKDVLMNIYRFGRVRDIRCVYADAATAGYDAVLARRLRICRRTWNGWRRSADARKKTC
jgi:hypothetical protein